ncbi:ABC-type dipeptide/oligopeptide/nickel transport system, permease component [Schinkia azotoformans MEV2011]|uniref:ABC-type dipeptide/oligopeptide/nickel transport system, permease component n=1 Tax=Schinkia azotoformans MEV2011 TaxID=1348973 RepID=A0A072NG63_SCHAZ|nr:ABC transporter permease subunit [Schinkia azotoformans]KEF36227.1 ABC-type dipeptide/oligopeptide/nickel transport system, permease component [Schinkia azotoformans MEV2011]MEC1693901.1 ABC transporter permease subunit [Schinkia azotoformans]MEC1724754.1 ABC transporter permease subunit [Schinkia azotoformans]MEC1770010.1 ABC transporter permease subunit [Schinkia azotoformans]MEC1780539.1 ABC transporter permease subunit [Schinkia azotoformans]
MSRVKKVKKLSKDKGLTASLVIIAGLFLIAIFAPWLAPHDPNVGILSNRLLPPSSEHWLGTDHMGRDLFSRIIYGTRTTMVVALIITAGCFIIGTIVGVTAGYAGGWVDSLLMRIVDLLFAFPSRILALVVVGIIGPGLVNLGIAMILSWWVSFARVIRGVTLTVKENEYVLAAELYGQPKWKIIRKHILPNVMPQLLVIIALHISWIMMALAGFSLLGLGVEAPQAEWGMMISEARPYMRDNGYLLLFPGLAIMIAVSAFTILGEKLRDVYDPSHLRV